jgi:hypothetical protein
MDLLRAELLGVVLVVLPLRLFGKLRLDELVEIAADPDLLAQFVELGLDDAAVRQPALLDSLRQCLAFDVFFQQRLPLFVVLRCDALVGKIGLEGDAHKFIRYTAFTKVI